MGGLSGRDIKFILWRETKQDLHYGEQKRLVGATMQGRPFMNFDNNTPRDIRKIRPSSRETDLLITDIPYGGSPRGLPDMPCSTTK